MKAPKYKRYLKTAKDNDRFFTLLRVICEALQAVKGMNQFDLHRKQPHDGS